MLVVVEAFVVVVGVTVVVKFVLVGAAVLGTAVALTADSGVTGIDAGTSVLLAVSEAALAATSSGGTKDNPSGAVYFVIIYDVILSFAVGVDVEDVVGVALATGVDEVVLLLVVDKLIFLAVVLVVVAVFNGVGEVVFFVGSLEVMLVLLVLACAVTDVLVLLLGAAFELLNEDRGFELEVVEVLAVILEEVDGISTVLVLLDVTLGDVVPVFVVFVLDTAVLEDTVVLVVFPCVLVVFPCVLAVFPCVLLEVLVMVYDPAIPPVPVTTVGD